MRQKIFWTLAHTAQRFSFLPRIQKKANKRAFGPFPRAQKASGTPFVLSTRMRSTMARGSTAAAAGPSSASMASSSRRRCSFASAAASAAAVSRRPVARIASVTARISLFPLQHGVSLRSRASGRGLRIPRADAASGDGKQDFGFESGRLPDRRRGKTHSKAAPFWTLCDLFCPVSPPLEELLEKDPSTSGIAPKRRPDARVIEPPKKKKLLWLFFSLLFPSRRPTTLEKKLSHPLRNSLSLLALSLSSLSLSLSLPPRQKKNSQRRRPGSRPARHHRVGASRVHGGHLRGPRLAAARRL